MDSQHIACNVGFSFYKVRLSMTKFIAQIHWFIIIILIQLARLGSSLRAYNHISNSKVSKESILILAKINALQPNEAVGEVLLLILHIL